MRIALHAIGIEPSNENSYSMEEIEFLGGLLVSISRLNGKKVIDANAYIIGEVEGAEVDQTSWQVTHLQVSLTDEAARALGFRKPFLGRVVICLPVVLVKAVGDVVSLDKSIQDLKGIPECRESK
jgi:sporulation protein YlmC with PRC-barrel domain